MIELVDVCIDHPRGGSPLLVDASLKVGQGEVVLIVDSAEVDASRLVAAALGEPTTRAGRIELLGHDVTRLRRSSLRRLRRRVGVVPAELCLVGDHTARLNVMLPLEIDGVARAVSERRALASLERLGLDGCADAPVRDLSAAERQRVAVARALVRDPALVIADQPTSMQDASGAEIVCRALAGAASAGACVLVIGSEVTLRAFAGRNAWRQLQLASGTLIALGAPASPPESASEEPFLDSSALEELPAEPDAAAPAVPPAPPAPLNVVPFPRSARSAGVA